MSETAIRFSGVEKRFDRKIALQGLDLEVRGGSSFGLAGMNGAGKTTLIKCLLDFCTADKGRIEIFGVDSAQSAARRPLAFLPERFMPPYYLTGTDFLRYMLKMHDVPYVEVEAVEMVSSLDLDPAALAKPARSYSKGMAQKLGLSACLLAKKRLYVLDEPMSGLDPRARASLKAHMKRLNAEGTTIFFSSHALADVDEICDRMAILHEGGLRFTGSPDECRRHYGQQTLEQAFLASIGNEAPA